MKEIVMLPIEMLEHHPQNPRTDLGDLTELADSIRAKGIMQNLTVVPKVPMETGTYLVVIGNRRFEAAKLAGLETLPCVIDIEMDEKEQIATMLAENMQRQDLTVYEQAQGFQMMMDLGFTQQEISAKTGFSESTVKNRLKLTRFKKDVFAEACANGATLMDFMEVWKIEDAERQEAILKTVGTVDFKVSLNSALRNQEYRRNEEKALRAIGGKIKEIKPAEKYSAQWRKVLEIQMEESEEEIKSKLRMADSIGKEYRYYLDRYGRSGGTIEIYKEEEKKQGGLSEEEKRKRAESRKRNEHVKKVKSFYEQAFELRCDFVKNFSSGSKANGVSATMIAIMKSALSRHETYGERKLVRYHEWEDGYIRKVLGLPEKSEEGKTIWDEADERSIPISRVALAFALGGGTIADRPDSGWFDSYDGKYNPKANNSKEVNAVYSLLSELGYKMSEFEESLRDGTHSCYLEDDETEEAE